MCVSVMNMENWKRFKNANVVMSVYTFKNLAPGQRVTVSGVCVFLPLGECSR